MTIESGAPVEHGARVGSAGSWWTVLRIALLLAWVAWAALSWWSAPRLAEVADARADLAAGRVVSYEWGASWRTTGWVWTGTSHVTSVGANSYGTKGPLFAWRTAGWRTRYVVLDRAPAPTVRLTPEGVAGYSGPEAAALAEDVRAAGFDTVRDDTSTFMMGNAATGTLAPVMVLVALLALSVVLVFAAGPAPVIGTRWYWFWVLTSVPLGLGLPYWLLRERPWSPTARPRTGPDGRQRRLWWYAGIGIALLAGLLAGLLVLGLHQLLGDRLVPYPRS